MAAIVGSTLVASAGEHPLGQRLILAAEMKQRDDESSSLAEMNAKMPPAINAGLVFGSVTTKKLRSRVHTRLRATISCVASKLCKPAATEMTTLGQNRA